MPGEAESISENILSFERRLKKYVEEDPRKYKSEISNLIGRLRSLYRELLSDHSSFLLNESRDIDVSMWKTCFYKPIEEFRARIRKYTAHIVSAVEKEKARLPFPYTVHQLQTHVASVIAELISFLSDGMVFYQSLVAELEIKIASNRKDVSGACISPAADTASLVRFHRRCMCRCLLYMGDLSRYKELYSSQATRSYVEAEKYYERAAMILPTSGNPQNQLAVLATYDERQSIAIYHYCRSIMVEAPFSGGFDNLSILFTKNKKLFLAERSQGYGGDAGDSILGLSKKQQELAKTKTFLTKFVRCHGVLFDASTKMHNMINEYAEEPVSTASNNNEGNSALNGLSLYWEQEQLDEFDDLVESTLLELDKQLQDNSLGDTVLVRLMVISLFSLHYGAHPELSILAAEASQFSPSSSNNSKPIYGEKSATHESTFSWTQVSIGHQLNLPLSSLQDIYAAKTRLQWRTTNESLALKFLFMFTNRLVTRITSSEKFRRTAVARPLLPVIGVFCEWAQQHAYYLHSSLDFCAPDSVLSKLDSQSQSRQSQSQSTPSQMFVSSLATQFLARKQSVRQEIRSRSSLRTSLALLKDTLEGPGFGIGGPSPGAPPPVVSHTLERGAQNISTVLSAERCKLKKDFLFLPEHLELRGFLPLMQQIEPEFDQFEPIIDSFGHIPEKIANMKRAHTVRCFIRMILIPIAGLEQSQDADSRRVEQQQPRPQQRQGQKLELNQHPPKEKTQLHEQLQQKSRQQLLREADDRLWKDPDIDAFSAEKRKQMPFKKSLVEENRGSEVKKGNKSKKDTKIKAVLADELFPTPTGNTAAGMAVIPPDNVWGQIGNSAVKIAPSGQSENEKLSETEPKHLEGAENLSINDDSLYSMSHLSGPPASQHGQPQHPPLESTPESMVENLLDEQVANRSSRNQPPALLQASTGAIGIDDDDELDDLVVFRPAFARSPQPSPQISQNSSRVNLSISGLLSGSEGNSTNSLQQLASGFGVGEVTAKAETGPFGTNEAASDFSLSFFELNNPTVSEPNFSSAAAAESLSIRGQQQSHSRLFLNASGGVDYGGSSVESSPLFDGLGSAGPSMSSTVGSNSSRGISPLNRGSSASLGQSLWSPSADLSTGAMLPPQPPVLDQGDLLLTADGTDKKFSDVFSNSSFDTFWNANNLRDDNVPMVPSWAAGRSASSAADDRAPAPGLKASKVTGAGAAFTERVGAPGLAVPKRGPPGLQVGVAPLPPSVTKTT